MRTSPRCFAAGALRLSTPFHGATGFPTLGVDHSPSAAGYGILACSRKERKRFAKWRVDEAAIAVYNAPGPIEQTTLAA